MSSDASSDVELDRASTALATSAPSSPPPENDPDASDLGLSFMDKQILEEEEKARRQNEAAEKRHLAAKARRKRKVPLSSAERAAKARELEELMERSERFGQELRAGSHVLGRVGSGMDGSTLGGQDIEMAEQPGLVVHGTMRPYQLEGLTWMFELASKGLSGILADEMGLGKTIQTISLIAKLREDVDHFGPHLIVAPLSTLSNWLDEFHRWTPSIPVVMYHGTPADREHIRQKKLLPNLIRSKSNGRMEPTARFPVVCTSYEVILRDHAQLSKINWGLIIIDEGHRMKNVESKLFEKLTTFSSETRLLITGTPLQNNLKELWALLHFLIPKVFRDWESFESWFDFDDLQDEEGTESFITDQSKQGYVKKLHVLLQPLLLRRVKADVAHYLPKKREYVLYAPMTKEQTDLYKAITDKAIDTRTYLEDKVVEKLTSTFNTPAGSLKSTPRSSRSSTANPKTEQATNGETISLSVRSKRQARNVESVSPSANSAFDILMRKSGSRGRPAKNSVSKMPVPTPLKKEAKRKEPPTRETSRSKSAKSSRESTPSTSKRGRLRKTRISYNVDDSDDDDALSDDEFEAKIAEKYVEVKAEEPASPVPSEQSELAETVALAKKQIANKKLGNDIMQLRLVCNSPHNFYNPWALREGAAVDESIVTSSGKMLLLDRLLPALFEKGHKVLIFSQFKTQLDILDDYCRELRGWKICRIDGSVAQDDRRAQIEEFNKNPDYKVFLLSTRAGGQGINLAAADTVILFDSDWNPQQDLQAQDRAHRIGQTRPVIVYRLATRNTVEETLLMSAEAKRRLEKLVIKKGGFRTMGQKADLDQDLDQDILRSLLLKDGEVYQFSGQKEILSDHDLEVLCDRSDEAYARAATGTGDADAYKVVETKATGLSALQV